MKRTLRILYITVFTPHPKRKDMQCYLISTTESANFISGHAVSSKLLDETARLFGFKSFVKFAHCMWPFNAPTHVRAMYSTNMFRIERNGELIAMISYSHVIAEIPTNKYYAEHPIIVPITDPTLIPSIVSLVSSKGE